MDGLADVLRDVNSYFVGGDVPSPQQAERIARIIAAALAVFDAKEKT